MRIADVTGLRSRRDKRREEAAQERRGNAPVSKRIKPAKRVGKAMRDLLLPSSDRFDRDSSRDLPLPSQDKLKHTSIRLRQHVDIILATDYLREELEVRHSIIEDIDDKGRLYLAQTQPPILSSQVGQSMELTFLGKYHDLPGGRWLRVGYRTPVAELIPNYKLGARLREPVVVVAGPKKLKPYSVRMSYRITPPDDLDLRLVLWPQGTELGLLDISVKGAKFLTPGEYYFARGKLIPLALVSGKFRLSLTGKVVRSQQTRDYRGWPSRMTGVRFVEMDPNSKEKLNQLLNETYRHLLAQRSGMTRRED